MGPLRDAQKTQKPYERSEGEPRSPLRGCLGGMSAITEDNGYEALSRREARRALVDDLRLPAVAAGARVALVILLEADLRLER